MGQQANAAASATAAAAREHHAASNAGFAKAYQLRARAAHEHQTAVEEALKARRALEAAKLRRANALADLQNG